MPNRWIEHVQKIRKKKANKNLSYKECLVKAKGSYKRMSHCVAHQKKQGTSDKTDEKQGMEIKGLKDQVDY
tara:strand:+ start:1069 stop:1281 length:213 start_codon:yes stop_codon:yes gene_type:complete